MSGDSPVTEGVLRKSLARLGYPYDPQLIAEVRHIAEQRAAEAVQPFLVLADELDAIAVDARAVARGLDQTGFSARSDRNHYRADALIGAARHIRAAALTATPNHGRNAT